MTTKTYSVSEYAYVTGGASRTKYLIYFHTRTSREKVKVLFLSIFEKGYTIKMIYCCCVLSVSVLHLL